MLTITHHIPDGLLTASATQLHQILPGPTLCHLTGKNPHPLFISVLLHGDETTGLLAVQQLLTQYARYTLPRSLSIFIGNVEAARWQRRRLDHQPDYNRIWCGTGGDEFSMANDILREMAQRQVFAAIDIHNNSAANPDYAMVPRLDPPSIALARMFSNKLVFFLQPHAAQSSAFGELCPAVTIECGTPGQREGVENSVRFLDWILNLKDLPQDPGPMETLNLYRIAATIKVSPSHPFGFDPQAAQTVCFMVDPARDNFQMMPQGTLFAVGCDPKHPCLEVIDPEGYDIFDRFFSLEDSKLITASSFVPAMLTMNLQIIRQDCLGYILEQVRNLPIPGTGIVDQRKAIHP
ncbi:MAG: succinylglutamate desuccinylase/aspartoacylase family protein [Magnetococcales bacterium]|nr:succinylglutamate desuccinylase/aspartoacylase family protein [Magnetococcales bacterium]